jgi:acyl carrier protein
MIASPGDHEPHPDEPHLEELHPSTVRHLFPLQTPHDSEELQGRLSEILIQISGADPAQITPEARLIEDIGIDSLGFYEILIEADESLGIKIKEEDLLKFRTVGDIQNHLRSLERPNGPAS